MAGEIGEKLSVGDKAHELGLTQVIDFPMAPAARFRMAVVALLDCPDHPHRFLVDKEDRCIYTTQLGVGCVLRATA